MSESVRGRSSGFQVSGNAAELYQQYPCRYLIAPWAGRLISPAALQPGERVLDVACGTGVVARLAAEKVGRAGHVTGLDINSGMLSVARSLPPPSGASIDWVEASAMATELADASFDVVLCQQGLQFFPDKAGALSEMRRVLVRGGRALLSVWRSMGPYNRIVGEALDGLVGSEVAAKFLSTRTELPDEAALGQLLTTAGFRDVGVTSSAMVVQLPHVEDFTLKHLAGTPVAAAVNAMSDAQRAELERQVKIALQRYANADGVAVPDEVNIAMGHA